MMTGKVPLALFLLAGSAGASAQEQPVPIPDPETQPTWDEEWAHPEIAPAVSGELPGFRESPEPLDAEPERPADERRNPRLQTNGPDASFDALAGASPEPEAKPKPKPKPPSLSEALAKSRRTGMSWDFQVEVGATVAATFWDWDHFAADNWSFISNPDFPIFFRARTGLLILKEPWYFGVGPTISYGGVGEWALGGQVELTSVWGGVWGQAEMAYSFKQDLVASIAAGYQLFGVEVKTGNGGRDVAVIAKVRAPIGLVAYVRGYLDRLPRTKK